MALATDTAPKQIIPVQPQPLEGDEQVDRFPAPLEFFKIDFIHPNNQEVSKREQQRWRLLGFWERLKLELYVAGLRRQLQRGKYNQYVEQFEKVKRRFRWELRQFKAGKFTSDDEREAARLHLLRLGERGSVIREKLDDLHSTHELYSHYRGWLLYEAAHRADLKKEDAREKKIREEMRRESKWLETLMIDVFRKTPGCHHITTKDGKEITKTPKFMRAVIRPDAHYFYVSVSRRVLFGYRWMLPYSVTINRLTEDDVLANLRAATKRQVAAVWSDTGQLMFRVSRVDSPDALPRMVKWRDTMKYFPKDRAAKFPYCVGATEGRKFHWYDFANDPHILVAGKSQSGKSNFVNGVIASLVSTHTPKELRLVLIDQKGGVEFTHWKEIPHLLWEMVKTVEQVEPILERVVNIMRRRMNTFEKVKAKDIWAYNSKVDIENQMEQVWVAIDEMNTFVGLGSQTERIHNLIMLIVSQGRAAGIHVITCTQHPEVKVIPGRIKTNMAVRACGAMPTVTASMIVLDNPEAARIPSIPGRFVIVVGLQTLIVQVPYISDEDIFGIVSAARNAYPDVANDLNDMRGLPQITIWDEQKVLAACVDWFDGHLSGQRLHKQLGDESPGERHLAKMCRKLIDEAKTFGYVTWIERDARFKVRKLKRGYYLEPLTDQPDSDPALIDAEEMPESASERHI